jgi:hypothetical protein
MGGGASIPLLIVPSGDAIPVGLAPIVDFSPSDASMLPCLLPARSLLSPVHLPAASFMAIVAIRQIARSRRTQKGQGLAWAARALGSVSLLVFICRALLASSPPNTSLEPWKSARIFDRPGQPSVRVWRDTACRLAGRLPAKNAGRCPAQYAGRGPAQYAGRGPAQYAGRGPAQSAGPAARGRWAAGVH